MAVSNLPSYNTKLQEFSLMQSTWATILQPVINNPINNYNIIKNVKLVAGSNSIDHKLGRALQGWLIVRQRGAASVHDDQDNNQNPNLTLSLVSSVPVSVDLYVY